MTKEQVQNIQDGQTVAEDGRERSSIQFPYNDLNSVIEVAKAIHDNAGMECTLDQLAAYMKQSMTSGSFRLRISGAATFGLTDNERGKVRLTSLGRRIADPAQGAAARAEAFLAVPLYQRIYDHYKGYTLPGAAAIEKFMREVGVAPKVTDKARQAFLRSARQAGFFEHGEDRLVKPTTPPSFIVSGAEQVEAADHDNVKTGGGGGGNPPDLHPFVKGLLRELPPSGEVWPEEKRKLWLDTAASIFKMIYKEVPKQQIRPNGWDDAEKGEADN